jgi:EF hand
MKRLFLMSLSLCVLGCSTLFAQPEGEGRGPREGQGGQEGREFGGEGGRGENRPPMHPLIAALDADDNHEISAEEIETASKALLKLDRNGDGKLTHEEFHEPREGGGDRGREAGQRGPEGRGPGDRGPDGGGPERRGPEGREGQGGPGFGGGPGGPGGRPDPSRFVDHVMEFDSNDDGLLSRDELMAFAESMHRNGPGQGGPGGRGPGGPGQGGPGQGGPGGPGQGGPGGRGPGGPDGNRGSEERPERPARPESE